MIYTYNNDYPVAKHSRDFLFTQSNVPGLKMANVAPHNCVLITLSLFELQTSWSPCSSYDTPATLISQGFLTYLCLYLDHQLPKMPELSGFPLLDFGPMSPIHCDLPRPNCFKWQYSQAFHITLYFCH